MASDIMAAGLTVTGDPLATDITGMGGIMAIGTMGTRKFMCIFIMVMGVGIFITGGEAALVVEPM